jgi:hypothetical protein
MAIRLVFREAQEGRVITAALKITLSFTPISVRIHPLAHLNGEVFNSPERGLVAYFLSTCPSGSLASSFQWAYLGVL